MPDVRPGNQSLKRALAQARLREVDIATALDVDPKTVRRWLDGRLPQARHRWALADLVGRHEFDLWPQVTGTDPVSPELVATYENRSAVPGATWRALFAGAAAEIGILVYSGLFLAEDAECLRILAARARAGVRVRILLGDPDDPLIARRGGEEGINEAMTAKVRNALVHYRPLLEVPGVELRLHATVLYTSIFRADDQLLVNPHVFGLAASHSPALHLRRLDEDGVTATYLEAFERVWDCGAALAGVRSGV